MKDIFDIPILAVEGLPEDVIILVPKRRNQGMLNEEPEDEWLQRCGMITNIGKPR